MLPFPLNSTSLDDVVESTRSDDFPSLENISEHSADIQSHIIDESAAYYVAGLLEKVNVSCKVCGRVHLLILVAW